FAFETRAQLLRDMRTIPVPERSRGKALNVLLQLVGLFFELFKESGDVGPVESNVRGPGTDLVGLHQRGHFRRNIIQQQRPALGLLLAARAPLLPFLLSLKGLPILEDGMRVFSLHVAEHMWVTGNELVAEGIENIVDGKMPGFLSHLR